MAVTWQNVQNTLGRTLTPEQKIQVEAWIPQARILINNRAIIKGTTINDLDQPSVDMVVTEAVADRLRRPDDATQVTVQVDDSQVSRRYETSTGQVRIRDEWWDLLFPESVATAGSVPLAYTPDPPAALPLYDLDGRPGWTPRHDW